MSNSLWSTCLFLYTALGTCCAQCSDCGQGLPASATIVKRSEVRNAAREVDVTFYTAARGAYRRIGVLVTSSNGGEALWKHEEDGNGFGEATGLQNILRLNEPQILVYRTIGASCQGTLAVYRFSGSEPQSLSAPWDGSCQNDLRLEDLDGDGIPEITYLPNPHLLVRDIYKWNGTRFVLANASFPDYYTSALNDAVGDALNPSPFPASARIAWAQEAVRLFIIQRRFDEGLRVCDRLRVILSDASLTLPNATGAYAPGMAEKEQRGKRAAVYHMKGDLYAAAGDQAAAEREYAKEKEIAPGRM